MAQESGGHMPRLTFLFIGTVQLSIVILAGCLVYAIVFNPEAIGATEIIIGFQLAFGGARQ